VQKENKPFWKSAPLISGIFPGCLKIVNLYQNRTYEEGAIPGSRFAIAKKIKIGNTKNW
jgi:hypothetical protein